jgi:hypothetical protein
VLGDIGHQNQVGHMLPVCLGAFVVEKCDFGMVFDELPKLLDVEVFEDGLVAELDGPLTVGFDLKSVVCARVVQIMS